MLLMQLVFIEILRNLLDNPQKHDILNYNWSQILRNSKLAFKRTLTIPLNRKFEFNSMVNIGKIEQKYP